MDHGKITIKRIVDLIDEEGYKQFNIGIYHNPYFEIKLDNYEYGYFDIKNNKIIGERVMKTYRIYPSDNFRIENV